jgi:hypothetical protein
MANNRSYNFASSPKNLFVALLIFVFIIIIMMFLSWRLSPPPLIFSEDFGNTERNQRYVCCSSSFTVEQGRLRITIHQTYYGCSVELAKEYDNFTFMSSVYPVQNVYDGSVNLLFRQGDNSGYEIQFRPSKQQINFIETAKNANRESYVKFTTGWMQTPNFVLNKSENKIKLTVTRNAMNFWFNDVLIFRNIDANGFLLKQGLIKVGVGAAETSGVAFEFDNIEIYSERLYSRWMYDFLAIRDAVLQELIRNS